MIRADARRSPHRAEKTKSNIRVWENQWGIEGEGGGGHAQKPMIWWFCLASPTALIGHIKLSTRHLPLLLGDLQTPNTWVVRWPARGSGSSCTMCFPCIYITSYWEADLYFFGTFQFDIQRQRCNKLYRNEKLWWSFMLNIFSMNKNSTELKNKLQLSNSSFKYGSCQQY